MASAAPRRRLPFHARRLLATSCSTLISVAAAADAGRADFVGLAVLATLSSILYWWHSCEGWRHGVDMMTASLAVSYAMLVAFEELSGVETGHKAAYWFWVATSVGAFVVSRFAARRSLFITSLCSLILHVGGNLSNIILYDGLSCPSSSSSVAAGAAAAEGAIAAPGGSVAATSDLNNASTVQLQGLGSFVLVPAACNASGLFGPRCVFVMSVGITLIFLAPFAHILTGGSSTATKGATGNRGLGKTSSASVPGGGESEGESGDETDGEDSYTSATEEYVPEMPKRGISGGARSTSPEAGPYSVFNT
jgi:hypothetical protein